MTAKRSRQELTIEGRKVPVSNLDKLLFPAAGYTKGHVIDYYIRAAPYLLPHLKNRPITLKRYPEGIGGEFFYEKDAPAFTPAWVERFPVPRKNGGEDIQYILINDLATLAWCANLASIELHPFLHRVPHLDRPTSVVFDLDPGEGATILNCVDIAFKLRDLFSHIGLQCLAKSSGSKGLQVYIPLNTPVTYDATRPFAKAVAQWLQREHPQLVVSEMAKNLRTGKVFIDWSQNADFKTTVSVYSMRAKRQHPFISMPFTWDELRKAHDDGDSGALYCQPQAALSHLEKVGDQFEPVLKLKQKLPSDFVKVLEARRASTNVPRTLQQYNAKRDFSVTAEPTPAPRRSHQGSRRRFVVQKHAASHLHYDFHLEMHDVLKSWAVPKGVPYTHEEKRLAMATEDHPIEYLDFEGTIPKGQYGGGTVMVWDIGTYELIEGNYYQGKLEFYLSGRKLEGEWTLVRDSAKGENAWLLLKTGSAVKPVPPKKENVSAKTGRTMEEIAEANDAQWQSNRTAEPTSAIIASAPVSPAKFIEPMRAKLANELPDGDRWEYEIKLDGYRCLALKTANGVKLLSRNNRTLNDRFPRVASAFETLDNDTTVDGEIVALDGNGRPSFNLLQNSRSKALPVLFYAFDLLNLAGHSTIGLPLTIRRQMLKDAVRAKLKDPVRFSETLRASPRDLVAAAKKQGLEGIVAKRLNSLYEPGQRSGSWLKYRTSKGQELVIGGYMPGNNDFDSLLVGYYDARQLLFIGKVKNGFTPALKQQVFTNFKGLGTAKCPFVNLPESKNARRGEALTPEVMKKCCWLKPELVAQVAFTDWTAANHLRHSRFIALREDKDARDVVHERAE